MYTVRVPNGIEEWDGAESEHVEDEIVSVRLIRL